MRKLVVAALLCGSLSVHAQGKAMYGYGLNCGGWVKKNSAQMKSFLLGYLSGLASMDPNKKDVLNGVSADQVNVWMDNFCRANPFEQIVQGANDLYYELSQRK